MTRLRPLFPAAIAAATLLLAAASPAGAAAPWVTSDSLVGDPALQSGGVRAVADHAGNVFAAWVGQAEDLSLSIIARRRAAGSASWDAPQTITAEGVQFDDPAIVASPNGDITVAWSRNNGSTTKIETTTRSAATGAWSPVERMPDTPGSASDAQCDDPQLVVDGSGTLTMIWREWGGAVVAARRPDGGAW